MQNDFCLDHPENSPTQSSVSRLHDFVHELDQYNFTHGRTQPPPLYCVNPLNGYAAGWGEENDGLLIETWDQDGREEWRLIILSEGTFPYDEEEDLGMVEVEGRPSVDQISDLLEGVCKRCHWD